MRTRLNLSFAVLVCAATVSAQAPAVHPVGNAPGEMKPAIDRAMKAFDSLQATLSARLMEEMKAGGPTRAVTVCRDEAPALTAKIAGEANLTMGRTSHKLRNGTNAPRPWVQPLLQKAAGRKASDVQAVAVDLGATIGVVRPIGMVGACTTCHGSDARRPPALKDALAAHYPQDKAVGFDEGDFRGFFWAEVPKGR